jgi:hypothetical protein
MIDKEKGFDRFGGRKTERNSKIERRKKEI